MSAIFPSSDMKKNRLIGSLVGACALVVALVSLAMYWYGKKDVRPAGNDTARPTIFTQETAMRAIFGAFNAKQKGTLEPVKNTTTWDIKTANVLATPMLSATFDEGGKKKGVLVIQRQMVMDGGEVAESHAQTADISVYVFTYSGTEWVFEKGKQVVATAGAHGRAPDGRLVRIGGDKYGLLFDGGDVHQGQSNDYTFLIDISDATVHQVLEYTNAESNGGNCSDDPAELADPEMRMHPCWGYESKLDFLKNGQSDYFILRARYKGTDGDDKQGRIDRVEYYAKSGSNYGLTTDAKYKTGVVVPEKDIFGVGVVQSRGAEMATVPRKLLK